MFTLSLNKVLPAVLTANVWAPPMVLLKLMLPNAPAPVLVNVVAAPKVAASP